MSVERLAPRTILFFFIFGEILGGLTTMVTLELSLLNETVDRLDGHGDRANDVQHVQDSHSYGSCGALWQIVQDYVLCQGAVGSIGQQANEDAE